jgi:hypothetical protein
MEERYRLFEAAQVLYVEEYNEAKQSDRLNRRILVIDEFQDLFTDKAFVSGVLRGCTPARRQGARGRVHLILAT